MATLLYTPKENGDLKLVAEVDGTDNAALALDALLDDNPRLKHEVYVAVTGDLEDGEVVTLTIDPEDMEPVNPRRNISVSGPGASGDDEPKAAKAPAKRAARKTTRRKAPAKPAPEEQEEAKPAKKAPAKRKPAAKKPAAKSSGRKPAGAKAKGKSGGSPFKKNARSAE